MAEEQIKKQMTKEGFEELQNELAERKTDKTAEITAKIMEAKAQGDLSENSEYEEARIEQAQNAARIEEIEAILKNAEVIDDSDISTDKVSLGAYVTLQNTATKEEYKYKLVGERGRLQEEEDLRELSRRQGYHRPEKGQDRFRIRTQGHHQIQNH